MIRMYISVFLLCVTLSACTSTATTNIQEKTVVHVVLIWLKDSGNQEDIKQVINVSRQLKEISYIQQILVGKSISSDRKIVDDSFDVGLYMTFSNMKDMQAYLEAPKHKEAVRTVLKPLASKIQVYDFVDVGT